MSFIEQACNTCRIQPVCKAYELIKTNAVLDISMIGCSFYEEEQRARKQENQQKIELTIQERLDMAEKIKAENYVDDIACDIIQPQKGVRCSACGKDNVQLIKCDECGALCCGDCITDTLNNKSLCPSCYESSEDTIPPALR